MTYDYVADTPDLGSQFCPECEPDRDPFDGILIARLCIRHNTLPSPSDTEDVPGERPYLSGTADAGGETNRIVCDGIHRGRWPA